MQSRSSRIPASGIKDTGIIKLKKARAFSLVEVVLAVGIAGIALVALLGLLPAGLKTFKSTMNTAVGSQIAERVFNDIQIANWADIQSTNRFFDEQGNELTGSGASNALNCIYWVKVSTTNASGANATTLLGNTSSNLMTVTIMVANNPAGVQSAATVFSGTNPNTLTFTTLIGRNK